ncbi:hypothetical protein A2U01_0018183, partial [Trifolium medium]|nr:hypothetical protein [Trifolium medium]
MSSLALDDVYVSEAKDWIDALSQAIAGYDFSSDEL